MKPHKLTWASVILAGAISLLSTAISQATPTIDVLPLGLDASLDGNVGLFLISSPSGGVIGPLTVNYTLGGTAVNGTDYSTLSGSVAVPASGGYAKVLVNGIPGAFSGTNKTVILTITPSANYSIYPGVGSATVILYDHNTHDPTKRYVRGTSTAADFHSFVVPVGGEQGVPLDAIGGNATNLFPGNQWTNTFYHFDATNSDLFQYTTNNRIPFQNPIVAFGTAGGSPLYLNQNYSFGIYAGNSTGLNLNSILWIQAYYRSNSAFAGQFSLPIPDTTQTNQLTGLVTNGFTQTYNGFGLQTVLTVQPAFQDWGNTYGTGFILTHTASAAATNYYYDVVELGSGPFVGFLVTKNNQFADYSRMYAMEFSPFPTGRSTFIDQPHFDGAPLPSAYYGKTVQELTNVAPSLPNLSFLTPTNYLALDGSPELRRHPILDQFVKDMGNDPLALANYVLNEIDLTDAVDYDTNYNSQPALNLGGLDRGAFATFQEGQGSPVEQCALLVYLLRQAGVPAAYVYPTNNGLQLLDFQASKLLRLQLHGAMNFLGQTNVPQLIPANYPWVAAYVGTNWVQIFPWIKDTEISEGFNLYDYMPTNYNSGYKWLTHFIAGDTNIFSLSNTSDQPLDLLPLFIQNNLDASFPGISVDDLGVQIVNRRHLYTQWNDFPKPFALTGTPNVIESFKTNANAFNTLEILAYSQANPGKAVDTTEMRVLDFHDRKLLLKFVQTGANLHNMILTLSPYSTNILSQTNFSATADAAWKLSGTNALDSTDDNVIFVVTHKRNKFLPAGYVPTFTDVPTNFWNFYYSDEGQQGSSQVYQTTNTFRKGDLIAFCQDVGRVSQKMLNVQALELWQFNQSENSTNPPATPDPDVYQGTPAYLMGMSYFNYADRFNDLNTRLHKIALMSQYEYGFGLLRPLRTSSGALTNNGQVIPILPAVHMPENGIATLFNNSLKPNLSRDLMSTFLDYWLQAGLQVSAAEHGVLRGFYQTNAISAVKLLQQAGTNAVALNTLNYLAAGTTVYNGVQLQNADPVLWKTVTNFLNSANFDEEVFITPGTMTNDNFVGMGALLFSSTYFNSPVSGLNGGFADWFSTTTFASANAPNITVAPAPEGATSPWNLQTAPPANNSGFLVDGSTTAGSLPTTYADLSNGSENLDPALNQATAALQQLYGSSSSSAATFNDIYNSGAASSTVLAENDGSQRASDPVNMLTGEFYIDDVDLTLPGPLNLQVRRNYSSLNLVEGSFGFGWKINYMPFLSLNTNSSLIYAAEMDGSVIAYRQTGTNAALWVPTMADNPTLNNNSSLGVGSVANLFNNRLQLANGTNYTLTGADGSVRTFTTQSFPIGTFTRQRPYLNTWRDNRGNSYAFQFGTNSTQPDYGQLRRIQASSGNSTGLYYDTFGHIIEAYAGDNRWLEYEYDKFGDLVTVTLPDESQINYVYQHLNQVTNSVTNLYSTHLMLQELKPEGRVLQNAYDSLRRVTNQLSTAGADLNPIRIATILYTNNFSLSSPTNLLTGATAIYDYTNHVTTYYYTNSLIRKIVDPLNQAITQDWYEANTNSGYQRSLKSRTDKRGLVTTYQYDSFGNVTNTTSTGNLTGDGTTTNAVTSATYNTNNLPLLIIDPVGNETKYVYTTNFLFLPQQIIRLAGTNPVSTNFSAYVNVTNVVTDGASTVTNTAFGLLTRKIRAYGSPDAATNDLFYSGQGFVTNSVQYTGTTDPAVTNLFVYNERGELVQRTDAAGRSYRFLYDPLGRPAGQETYEAGQSVPVDFNYSYYNENGELEWTDGPRFNPEDYIFRDYDGAGRKCQEIHWRSQGNPDGSGVSAATGDDLYATTFYQYDPLGDLTQITDPLGNYVVQNFDAISRLTQQVFYASNGVALATNRFSYEPGGLVASTTNALGGVNTKLYTSSGQTMAQTNPDGSTNAWRYDLTGRVVKKILPNGNYWLAAYDDLNKRVTKTFRNATTTLATNIVQFDNRGNVIQHSDLLGNLSTNYYDGLDRIRVSSGPIIVPNTNGPPMVGGGSPSLHEFNTYLYDGSGQVLAVTNALGEKTVTTSDALGRPTQVAIFAANNYVTPIRLTSSFYSPDHQSVTVTNGTVNPIVTTTYTDNSGNPVLTIGYPTNGVREYVWQKYDRAENRIAQQQSSFNGSQTLWATNGWTYDGLNRLIAETNRDGAFILYSQDALGNVTNRAMPGGLTWNATYLSDGRIATEKESGGGLTTRSNFYQYYATGSPFAGMLQTVADGRNTTRSNSYDDFLRLSAVSTTGTAAEQQTSTTYQYDLNGQLANLSQSYSNAVTGPSTTIQRNYDSYSHLVFESVLPSAGKVSIVGQGWDNAGRRTQLQGITTFNYRADGLMTGSGFSTFGYADNGLFIGRTNSARVFTVNQRDGRGRILKDTTTVGTNNVLVENLTWRNDGRLTAYAGARSDFTNNCNYSYTALSQRLAQESFNVGASQSLTNVYVMDAGQASGLGVLTANNESGSSAASWNSGSLDGLSRVTQATNSLISRPATGKALGAATVSVTLDGKPVGVVFDNTDADGRWRCNLDLTAGSHTLALAAVHPSGLYTATSNLTFSVASGSADTIQSQYDGNGNVTQRVWVNSLGQTNRTQTLTWDAFDRLIKVSDRDASTNGFDFVSAYDGLNRRIHTAQTIITNGAAITAPPDAVNTVDSEYDPQVEFLEVETTVNGRNLTFIGYGPDANGVYGGMQGVGGLDTVAPFGQVQATGVVLDYFGNALATVTNSLFAWNVSWNPSRFSSYGPVPGYQPLPLSINTTVAQAVGWRGKRIDPTGTYYFGGRPAYDPVGGRFLSFDPQWNPNDAGGYSAFRGDPVNFFDADGRLGREFYQSQNESVTVRTFLGDVSFANGGTSISSGGLNFFVPDHEYFNPFQDAADAFQQFGKDTYNLASNKDARDAAWNELQHPDFSTPIGWLTYGVAGVSYAANTADAIANFIPGKAALEDAIKGGVKTGVKDLTEIAAKDAAQAAKRVLTEAEEALYGRVSHPKGFREQVWEMAKGADGNVYDPNGRILKFNEPWELGHTPANKFSDAQLRAAQEGWDRQTWIRYQNDPRIYRPELPSSNASHRFE
jgi:RHS repeat-associated protein